MDDSRFSPKKRCRSDGEELDNFYIQNSPVDNQLTKIGGEVSPKTIVSGEGAMDDLNEIVNTTIDGQTAIVPVKSRNQNGKHAPIYTLVSFSYDESEELAINARSKNKLTAFDKRVLNAIGTLWLSDKNIFSLNEIYCVANAYTNKNPTGKQKVSIKKSIDKLSAISVRLDVTEEVSKNNIPDKSVLIEKGIITGEDDDIGSIIMKGRLLPISTCEITSKNGKKSLSIKLDDEPLLVTYNRAKRTLLSIPMEYMKTTNFNFSDRSVAFQDYLIKRIYGYGRGYFTQNKILYKTILETCGFNTEPEDSTEAASNKFRQQKLRDRDLIKKMFDYWISIKLIDKFEEIVTPQGQFEGIIFEMSKKIGVDNSSKQIEG